MAMSIHQKLQRKYAKMLRDALHIDLLPAEIIEAIKTGEFDVQRYLLSRMVNKKPVKAKEKSRYIPVDVREFEVPTGMTRERAAIEAALYNIGFTIKAHTVFNNKLKYGGRTLKFVGINPTALQCQKLRNMLFDMLPEAIDVKVIPAKKRKDPCQHYWTGVRVHII